MRGQKRVSEFLYDPASFALLISLQELVPGPPSHASEPRPDRLKTSSF